MENTITLYRIKDICKANGITIKELAKEIGMTSVGVSKAMEGNTTFATIEKIATALGVEPTELFDMEEAEVLLCPHCHKPFYIVAD